MGLFDDVTGVGMDECPTCGGLLGGFQTKDADFPCMDKVDFREVQNFYALCLHCRTWVEFDLKELKPPAERTLDDYELTIETHQPAATAPKET